MKILIFSIWQFTFLCTLSWQMPVLRSVHWWKSSVQNIEIVRTGKKTTKTKMPKRLIFEFIFRMVQSRHLLLFSHHRLSSPSSHLCCDNCASHLLCIRTVHRRSNWNSQLDPNRSLSSVSSSVQFLHSKYRLDSWRSLSQLNLHSSHFLNHHSRAHSDDQWFLL